MSFHRVGEHHRELFRAGRPTGNFARRSLSLRACRATSGSSISACFWGRSPVTASNRRAPSKRRPFSAAARQARATHPTRLSPYSQGGQWCSPSGLPSRFERNVLGRTFQTSTEPGLRPSTTSRAWKPTSIASIATSSPRPAHEMALRAGSTSTTTTASMSVYFAAASASST